MPGRRPDGRALLWVKRMERLLSVVAFVFLCGFLAVLVQRVPRLDLGLVCLICVLLCAYDLFLHKANPERR